MGLLQRLLSKQTLDAVVTGVTKAAIYSKPTAIKFAHELRPPLPQELPRAIREGSALIKGRKNINNLTVKEAFVNAVVTAEVICWFFVGECIGKGTIIGYQV